MPNVSSLLAERGASFTQFIVSAPDCCPSRVSLLRGQYVHDHGILRGSNKFGEGKFRSRGLGRFHDRNMVTPGWLPHRPRRQVSEWLCGRPYPCSTRLDRMVCHLLEPVFRLSNQRKRQARELRKQGRGLSDGCAFPKVGSFIRRSAKAGKRFFLYLTPSAPHGPATPAPRHESLFAETTAPRTASFNEEDLSDKPEYIQATLPMTQTDVDTIDQRYRDRLRALQAVDEMVAKIVKTLKDTKTLSSTYIVFTSDNGYLLGQHRRRTKAFHTKRRSRRLLCARPRDCGWSKHRSARVQH